MKLINYEVDIMLIQINQIFVEKLLFRNLVFDFSEGGLDGFARPKLK